MKAKKFLMASMLVAVMGLVAGCASYDTGHGRGSGYNGYGYNRAPYESHGYYRR